MSRMGLVFLAKLLNAPLVEYFQDVYATPYTGHCTQAEKHTYSVDAACVACYEKRKNTRLESLKTTSNFSDL